MAFPLRSMRYPKDDRGRFISGIHNYCDRWCESCRFTDRCRVHQMEQDRLARRLLRGGEPETAEEQAAELRAMMEDMLDSVAAEHDEEDDAPFLPETPAAPEELPELPPAQPCLKQREPDPLVLRADTWGDSLETFLERIRAELPGLGYEVEDKQGAVPQPRPGVEPAPGLAEFGDGFEVLHYFRYFIPVKTRRAIGFDEWPLFEEEEEDEGPNEDQLGTAKLVHECLGRCSAALWSCAGFHAGWIDAAVSLANEAEAMRQSLDERLPRHRFYVRPGLDEL